MVKCRKLIWSIYLKIKIENLYEILALFNITSTISNFIYLINGINEKSSEIKIIMKVEFFNRSPLIVKLIKENHHPNDLIEEQSIFSEYLRSQGVLTAKRYKKEGRYCIEYQIENIYVDITVEDYIGDEIKAIDFNLAYKIGDLLAKIHNISEAGKCHINNNTIFNLVGNNDVISFKEFEEIGESGKIDREIFQLIRNTYYKKLEAIKMNWNKLPKYATQGDISINNLIYIGEDVGIFDYNIAGKLSGTDIN